MYAVKSCHVDDSFMSHKHTRRTSVESIKHKLEGIIDSQSVLSITTFKVANI